MPSMLHLSHPLLQGGQQLLQLLPTLNQLLPLSLLQLALSIRAPWLDSVAMLKRHGQADVCAFLMLFCG